jgi:hypothetical protein
LRAAGLRIVRNSIALGSSPQAQNYGSLGYYKTRLAPVNLGLQ